MTARSLTLVGVVCLALLVAGCATRTARLYDLQSAEVVTATFRTNGTGHGPIWLGESFASAVCKGEYVTVPQGSAGWGTIYNGAGAGTVTTTLMSTDQQGSAVVSCTDGRVIECEYVTSALSGRGHGSCQDNQAHHYRAMF